MSDRIDGLAKRAVDPRIDGWERGQAVAELATIARKAEAQRSRADVFRDVLADACGCPPSPVEVACQEGDPCPFISDDGHPDYAACWDEVERRQR